MNIINLLVHSALFGFRREGKNISVGQEVVSVSQCKLSKYLYSYDKGQRGGARGVSENNNYKAPI